jgi:hypothetical protein
MLKKLAVPFLTLAVATFGCSSTTTPTPGTGGAGGTSAGGAGGASSGGHGGATGGAAGGASGGAAGGASGGAAGGASGGAAGGASGGAAGHAAGGAGGTAAGGTGGGPEVDGGVIKVYQNVVMDGAMAMVDAGAAAMGTATVTLNETTGVVSVSGTFSGLSGTGATMAHIHGLETAPGAGTGLPVIVPLVATAATSGTLTGSGTLTPTEVTGMLNGLTYLNIHTVANPAGEIRGNIGP